MKHFNRLIHILGISLIIALVLSFSFPSAVFAASNTVTGTLTLTPTIENIGVICSFTGDDNGNNNAVLEYREAGGNWKTAPQMWKDTRTDVTISKNGNTVPNPYPNTYRGSIFWLTTNTQYEVRVTFTDSDGISGTNPVTGSVTTLNDNPPSTGNAYYVSTTGNDSNAGTEASPFRTIGKAASVVAAGSTVYVKAGTYNEEIDLFTSGTENNYITFRPYGSDIVTINGGFYINPPNSSTSAAKFIRIKGFIINNTATCILVNYDENRTTDYQGIIIEDNNITISGTSTDSAIRLAYNAKGIIVQRNTLTIDLPSSDGYKCGIYMWRAGGYFVIRDNIVNGKSADGFGGGPENELGHMSDTDVYNNIVIGAWDDGIQMDGDDVNTRIYNNVVSDSFGGSSTCPDILGPAYIFRNVFYDLQYRNLPNDNQGIKLGDGSTGPPLYIP